MKVCIVGFSELNRKWPQSLPPDYQIWSLNEAHNCTRVQQAVRQDTGETIMVRCPCFGPPPVCFCRGHEHSFLLRYDRWFQIHPSSWKEDIKEARAKAKGKVVHEKDRNAYGRNEKHMKFLAACKRPVYMLHPDPRIPTAVQYPIKEVTRAVGIRKVTSKWLYVTSTPAYMMALAIYEHLTGQIKLKEFAVSGLELAIGTEYYWQRPCLEYYLGLMKGMGIKVRIPQTGTSLLSAPRYALDPPPVIPWSLKDEKTLSLKKDMLETLDVVTITEPEDGRS